MRLVPRAQTSSQQSQWGESKVPPLSSNLQEWVTHIRLSVFWREKETQASEFCCCCCEWVWPTLVPFGRVQVQPLSPQINPHRSSRMKVSPCTCTLGSSSGDAVYHELGKIASNSGLCRYSQGESEGSIWRRWHSIRGLLVHSEIGQEGRAVV